MIMTKHGSPPRANPQPVSRCCAPTCNNSSDNTSGVSFFRFPKDEERCRKWVANCGRLDLRDKPAEKLFANYRLCSAHFMKESFSSTYRNSLVWNAVPTLFKNGDQIVSKGATSKKKLLPGRSQQKYRRFFGFASKCRTSVQRRPNPVVQTTAAGPMKPTAKQRPAPSAPVVEEEPAVEQPVSAEEDQLRLPDHIEDHMYAVPTVHLPSNLTLKTSPTAPRFTSFKFDPENQNHLVMNVVDGEDPVALKAAMEAVEAALPLLQLSQQPPLVQQSHAGGTTGSMTAPTITYVTVPASTSSAAEGGSRGEGFVVGGEPIDAIPAGTTFTVTMQDPTSTEVTVYPGAFPPNDDNGGLDDEFVDEDSQDFVPPSDLPAHTTARHHKSRKGPRLMQDFLIPHLDSATFGDRLKWVDRDQGIFQIGWYHKSAAQWTNDDCVVFLEWDKLKKRPVAHSPHYWMEAKQRFRAALGKVSFGWTPPNRDDYKNVKLRKIKWTEDMQPPLGWPWKPWNAPAPAPAGRVHRPTISRVHKVMLSLPSVDEAEEEEDMDSAAAGEVAVCHRCGYVTRNQRVFLRHRMMHRDVRAFCCRYCPARFCLPESLFLHLQVHTESHPYTCSSCGVRTRLLLQLWRHELRSLAQRLCLCHRCGLICHIRENLRQHLLKVHKVSVSSAFDTKPFQVCPGPMKTTGAGTAANSTVPSKQPTQWAAGKPASKCPTKAAAKPKTDKAARAQPKPGQKKAVEPGTFAKPQKPAVRSKPGVGRGRVAKAKLPASTEGKSTGPPSTKKVKREDNESKVCIPKAGGATNGMPKMQQGCKVEVEPAVPSDTVHTARKTAPKAAAAAGVPTMVAFQTPSGEMTIEATVLAAAPTEQGRRKTQRIRIPKRKISV
uniref:52 kD repressor of inhibitor of protein kinase n=1 Tax=Rhipicephalus appendiculatus TaxID=34631 RepID=A0A131YXZ2_RHIAP